MTKKYFGGTVPAPAQSTEFDASLIETVRQTVETYKAKMDDLHIADAEDAVFAMLRRANKYIDETAPWVLAKDESKKEVLGTVRPFDGRKLRCLRGGNGSRRKRNAVRKNRC